MSPPAHKLRPSSLGSFEAVLANFTRDLVAVRQRMAIPIEMYPLTLLRPDTSEPSSSLRDGLSRESYMVRITL